MSGPVRITGVFAGSVEARWPGKPPSAIRKDAVVGRVIVGLGGLTCDAQADLAVHGGPDKALHHYPAEHYLAWLGELGRNDLMPGSFGENLSTNGITETTACIGDVFDLGTARIQISQGRQPCWKLNAHTDDDQMAFRVQKTGRTGWYYRVLSPGTFEIGDTLTLVDRPHPNWTVFRVTAARLTRRVSSNDAAVLAQLPELAEGWRAAFQKMMYNDRDENTRSRLQAPKA